MKTLWYINYYTSLPELCSNPRSVELSKAAVAAGYKCRVFFADYKGSFIKSNTDKFENRNIEGVDYTVIRAEPYKGNIDRGISIFRWALSLKKFTKKLEERPDVILWNIHAPFDYPVVWLAKGLKAKLIVEAWDLWPDSFVRFGLMKASSPITKFFYSVEKKMYEHGDAVIFTLEGGKDYLKERGWTTDSGGKIDTLKVYYINNGVNIEKFKRDCHKFPTEDPDLLDRSTFKVIYMGAIRLVNHVKTLIDAAAILKDRKNIKFFIYGDGPEREELVKYIQTNDIDNVIFKQKRVSFCCVADIVSHADLNIMNYQKGFGKYGVSSGKLFQYLAAGKPILCNISLNYDEITSNSIGIAEEMETPQEYAEAILRIANLSKDELETMQQRTLSTARKFDYNKLSAEFLKVVETVQTKNN